MKHGMAGVPAKMLRVHLNRSVSCAGHAPVESVVDPIRVHLSGHSIAQAGWAGGQGSTLLAELISI